MILGFKSAFDTIWRKALWKMMRAIGVSTKIVNIIEKMYNNTQCSVAINGQLTKRFQVAMGVRQGCLLSPTLFSLFLDFVMAEIDSLQDEVKHDDNISMDVLYADDTQP